VVSAEQVLQRAEPEALARQALRPEPWMALAEQVPQPAVSVVSGQQAAALPPEGRVAAAVRLPAADAVGAPPGAEAVPQPEALRALAAQVPGAAAEAAVLQPWAVPGARQAADPSAAAWVCHPRAAPAPPPAERFARATTDLQIASP
jgi:hypothetical protein